MLFTHARQTLTPSPTPMPTPQKVWLGQLASSTGSLLSAVGGSQIYLRVSAIETANCQRHQSKRNNRSNRPTLGDIHCGNRVQFRPVPRLHNERSTVHLIFCLWDLKSDLILSHWASSSFNMRTMPRVYNYRLAGSALPKPTPSPNLSWSRSLSMENVFITNSSCCSSRSNSCETRLQTNNNHYKHRK